MTSLVNPAFSEDFSAIVTDGAIYSYTAKSGATAGSYSVTLTETSDPTKKIWKDGNNLIVFTSVLSATATKYDYKVRFFTFSDSAFTKMT